MLAADYPMDWTDSDKYDGRAFDARDEYAASVITEQILAPNRKALILFGAAHLYRNRSGTIMQRLQYQSGATAFIVVPIAGPDLPLALKASGANDSTPVLIRVDHSRASLAAADVLEHGTKRLKLVDGKPVFENGKPVFVPVFEAGAKLGDLVDACLYFGDQQPPGCRAAFRAVRGH